MKRNLIIFFILLNILSIVIIFILRDEIGNSIYDNKFYFIYPDLIAVDSETNIYVIDNGWKRLVKMSFDGEVLYIKQGGKRKRDDFYEIWFINIDDYDNVYVINNERNLIDGFVEKDNILKFDKKGNLIGNYIYNNYESEERKEIFYDGKIMAFDFDNENIYYLYKKDDDSCYFYKYNIINKTTNLLDILPFGIATDVKGLKKDKIYLTIKDGNLYFYDRKNKILDKVKNINQVYKYPWAVGYDKAGNIYFTDLIEKAIFRLSCNNEIKIIFNEKILRKQINSTNKILCRNMYVRKDGLIATIDEPNQIIYLLDNNGNLIKSYKTGYYNKIEIFKRLIVYFFVILSSISALIIIYYVYNYILNKKISLVLKQLLIFLPIILFSVIYISRTLYSDLYNKYYENLSHKLRMFAEYISRIIDVNALERINKPSDYGSKYYNKLNQQLLDLLSEEIDKDNMGLYAVIYKVYNDQFYYSLDLSGYYGVMYPYSFVQDVHKEAYYNGRIGSTVYTDVEGEWIIGVSPIKNEKGNIVGVLEVGMNGYILNELNSILLNNQLKGIFISISLFIIIYSLLTYFILYSVKRLRKAVMKVSNGNLDINIKVASNDEIGDLENGFNLMTQKLKLYFKEIMDLNKNLEKIVEERTKELSEERNKLKNKNEQIEKELYLAKNIQFKLIPEKPPTSKVSFYYKPMEFLGGDFFDFITFDDKNKLGLFISDVSGHGVPAAFITTLIKGFLLKQEVKDYNPAKLLIELNNFLYNQTNGNFITAFYCIYDFNTNNLVYANAGHNSPFYITNEKITKLEELKKGTPLGIFHYDELISMNKIIENHVMKMENNSKLLIYTDGFIEATKCNFIENELDFENSNLLEVLEKLRHLDPKLFLAEIYLNLIEFHGKEEFDDDICLICLNA